MVRIVLLIVIMAVLCYVRDAAAGCRFTTATATLAFGNLDPGAPVDVNATTSVVYRCTAITAFTITDDDGLYETGIDANRMNNTTAPAWYLPYSFTYTPSSGTAPKNTDQTLTINGTVKGIDYQNAYFGSYSDSVVLTITP